MTLGDLFADRDLYLCTRLEQSLLISVNDDEFNAADIRCYHTVNGVVSSAAYTYYLYYYTAFVAVFEFKWHFSFLR